MIHVSRIGLLTLAFALVATVTFAAAEAEEAAAAEKEMVLDPTTGEMITAPEYGGTLIYGRTGTGEHCDAWANSGWSHHFVGVVTEQLTIANWGIDRSEDDLRLFSYPLSTMKGQLAERWEAPDATTFIAHIRPGVRWHDKAPMNGRELTASDVEFNYHRTLGLGSGCTEASPHAGQYPKMESVTATDASTVVFKLAEPDYVSPLKPVPQYGGGFGLLNMWIAWIYPPEVIQEHGDIQDCMNLVGTGPMELTDLVEGSSVTWTRNPNYWGFDEKFPDNRLPYADEIVTLILPDPAARIAALRSGQVDMLCNCGDSQLRSIDQVESLQKTDPNIRMWERPGRSDNAFRFLTVSRPPFNDIRVRQALQMALDRETISNTYFKGFADPTPHGILHNDGPYGTPFDEWPEEIKQYYRYDPERARQLLAEAGYPDGFKTEMKYFERYDANYAELVIGYWAEIGVDVEMSIHGAAEILSIAREHTSDGITSSENSNPTSDINNIDWFFGSGSSSRMNDDGLGVNDPHMDELIAAAKSAGTLEEITARTKEANLYALGQHWQIDGPGPVPQFNVAQPWIKSYNGEVSIGVGQFTTILTRLWIDQDLKREMGF